jgi:endonuclease/exonuclease/phosphatase family metal-dependent hydrolase
MVTTQDAATTTPRIVDVLRARDVDVAGLEEHQPTFDEVFTGLVEQRRAMRQRDEWAAAAEGGEAATGA